MIKLTDSHCHLDFEPLSGDLEGVLARAQNAGVGTMINIGTSIERSLKSVDLTNRHPNIRASVGLHPQDAGDITDIVKAINQLRNLARDQKVVAIGEIGLDYYSPRGPITTSQREKQKELLIAQLELAHELRLPIIFHIRDAWDDFFELVTGYQSLVTSGVVHCYTGDAETAERLVNMGFYIGFTGMVTFGQSKFDHIRAAAKAVPLENILVETDAPFLAPEPYRGKTNEPAYVVEVAKKIADLKGKTLEGVAEQTTKNAEKLFGI